MKASKSIKTGNKRKSVSKRVRKPSSSKRGRK